MKTMRYVYWQEEDMWMGYLEEYPDYMTQGETLEELQENPIVKSLGVSMYKNPDGQVAGITASNLSSNPIAGLIGLQDNDVVQSVNGQTINSMEQLPQLYEKFKNERSFQVGILRNGQQQTLTVKVPDFIK